ncbi:tRNA (adenosine(37)-N6)-threonylcarbamoyltransferase complex ATPase subunit type 1 TsaE [Amylibacter marinus]|nr:tRNA (adenosine(37)-N6)-threonylcarbamoyltransferase complex ATPase subunit type 1 TsaE [Amylibacter marinus]
MDRHIRLSSEPQSARFANSIAPHLAAGDCLLLSGEVGAGKSFFARHVIRARLAQLGRVEDIPSPTFTLVQTYELESCDIWHADLYRLTGPDEVYELGLEAAFETDICLVEWPDRLAELTPSTAITLAFDTLEGDARAVRICWNDPRWDGILLPIVKEYPIHE